MGLFYETVLTRGERPMLIGAFLALCGLPAFLRADEKAREQNVIVPPEQPEQPLTQAEIGRALMRLSMEDQRRADRGMDQ